MDADAAEQVEEKETLLAIYGTDCEYEQNTCRVYLPSKDSSAVTVLRALLPAKYPSAAGPVLEVEAPHVPAKQLEAVVLEMEAMFVPGEVCLFNCIEWLREQLQQWQDAAAAAIAEELQSGLDLNHSEGSSDGPHSSSEDESDASELQQLPESSGRSGGRKASDDVDTAVIQQMRPLIISGEPFTERKSTFQAHVAPVINMDQVKAVVAILLENNKIRNATHNIMAYRITPPDKGNVCYQDFDDDGEAAAGGRLLHLLQVANAGNVVVVVSRWFGGILLGPARFGLINNTARQLLEQSGFLTQQAGQAGGKQGSNSGKKLHKKKH
eukprot:GHUV01008915.1.p1 GENE.GHUV01008915.1~~GHUV01008915.1.p1  ORF type:complete len:325 (+),score=92.08 GHUV01008915.1:304-1278(+)